MIKRYKDLKLIDMRSFVTSYKAEQKINTDRHTRKCKRIVIDYISIERKIRTGLPRKISYWDLKFY